MNTFKSFSRTIYEVNDYTFTDIALEVFQYQARNNPLYSSYINTLKVDPVSIKRLEDIPFLPISFFKTHAIQTDHWTEETVFTSSGTTGSTASRHLVFDLPFYLENSRRCFEYHFGSLEKYHFLALLPSYLERTGSSLISMIAHFIEKSNSRESGFYLREHEALIQKIHSLKNSDRKIIVWGVSFALLDLAEQCPADLSECLIFETGGMKGRRREITRSELHEILGEKLNARQIFSEYGMTELLSQAYSTGGMAFKNPPFMKVLGRDLTDPLEKGLINETAGINVIDLANFHSISFIETQDLGKIYPNGTFEILGRMDNSDIRGCNLMV